MKNEFYFNIFIEFESDYDVANLENIIGLKPRRLLTLKDCAERVKKAVVYEEDGSTHGIVPTAKFLYRSERFSGIEVSTEFEKFIENVDGNLEKIIPILEENKGRISFTIFLTKLKEIPYFYFSPKTIKIIAKYNSDIEIDYE